MHRPDELLGERLPARLRSLAGALRRLSPGDRRLVLEAVGSERRLATIPWEDIESVEGAANVGGGDAIEDSDRLYDAC